MIILYIILLFLSGNRDMQLLQLFLIHLSGRLCHQTGSILHLGERDHVADTVSSHHQHHNAVQAICQACVRRNTLLKCFQKEAELLSGPLRRKAQHLKHLGLDISLMDTDRSAAHLHAVQHNIICLGTNPAGIRINIL